MTRQPQPVLQYAFAGNPAACLRHVLDVPLEIRWVTIMKTSWFLVVLFSLLTMCCLSAECFPADRTVTEELIHAEIMRLGGEWEGYKAPVRLAFTGKKFTERHFEMLEHIHPFPMLSLAQVEIGPDAMESISKLTSLKDLFIQQSTLASKGSDKISRLKSLTSLELHECKVAPEWIRAIGEVPSLRRLLLYEVDLPSDTLEIVAHLKNLEHLDIDSPREFKAKEIETLKAKLPRCKITIWHTPPR
jgi:hypothetical protein